jgi:hypothetical protein
MDKYIYDVLNECEDVNRIAVTPANDNLFELYETSKLLSLEMKDKFHTRVAKLLYLAKRVRPDILVTTVFLTTRVLRPNEEELSKLE